MDLLKSELDSYVRRNFDVTIVCSSQEREKNLREFLIREKLDGRIAMKQGTLTAGMEFTDDGRAISLAAIGKAGENAGKRVESRSRVLRMCRRAIMWSMKVTESVNLWVSNS